MGTVSYTHLDVYKRQALDNQTDLPIAVKNLYYGVLSAHPEYKYAYDLTAEVGEDGLLYCTISYMPYRTGEYPAGFQGTEVASLAELLEAAQQGITQESIPIRITNPSLLVDDMNRSLQQVGGGYPVSYTHLDVYKRQGEWCMPACSSPASRRFHRIHRNNRC